MMCAQRPDFVVPPDVVRRMFPGGIVEPFPAPTSPQERPQPEDVSAHGSGRQRGMAGLSLPGRGTE